MRVLTRSMTAWHAPSGRLVLMEVFKASLQLQGLESPPHLIMLPAALIWSVLELAS